MENPPAEIEDQGEAATPAEQSEAPVDEEGQEATVPEEPIDAGVAADQEEIQIPVEASELYLPMLEAKTPAERADIKAAEIVKRMPVDTYDNSTLACISISKTSKR